MSNGRGINLRSLVAAFVVFSADTWIFVSSECSWGWVSDTNVLQLTDVANSIYYNDVYWIEDIKLHACEDGRGSEFFEVYTVEEVVQLTLLVDRNRLEEETPSAPGPHKFCFYLTGTNCESERRFTVVINDTNNHAPFLMDKKGVKVTSLTYDVTMPLLKDVNIGIELLVKDIDITNLRVNVSIIGNDLNAVYDGVVDSLNKVHRFYLVPTKDLQFLEREFELLIEDAGKPKKITKAKLILKKQNNQTQVPTFERYYYEGTYKNGQLKLPSIVYANADNANFTLISEQGYQDYFSLRVAASRIGVLVERDLKEITDNRIILVIVAGEPKCLSVQQAVLIIDVISESADE